MPAPAPADAGPVHLVLIALDANIRAGRDVLADPDCPHPAAARLRLDYLRALRAAARCRLRLDALEGAVA